MMRFWEVFCKMLIFLLVTLIILLLVAVAVEAYYLIRFARIIFLIEDNLENALETLNAIDESLKGLLEMKLFFDSKEVKYVVDQALSSVRLSKVAIVSLINDFTRLSKEKYITVRSDEEDFEQDNEEKAKITRRLP